MGANLSIIPKGFRIVGYFLVEATARPACFALPCKRLLSLSDCIANIYPPEAERTSPSMMTLAETALFSPGEGRFARRKDALAWYGKYSRQAEGLHIVGQCMREDLVGRFLREAESLCRGEEAAEPKTLLGGEILGFDGGLHSYLCNGLDKDLRDKFPIRWNSWGLIENSYEEMCAFASFIQGLGETVDWLPCLLFDYTP